MIPKIIHQIWSVIDEPLPDQYKLFGETWIEHHPTWKYELWDNDKMNKFVQDFYPQYWAIYNNFPFNVQRWDAIRYLILDKIGGMYTDFDSECIKPLDKLLKDKTCCFSMEPQEHGVIFKKDLYFNNALIASIPNHPFIKKVIEKVFTYPLDIKSEYIGNKVMEVLTTTGPLMLVELYEMYPNKDNIYLIPSKFTSPFTKYDIACLRNNMNSEELERKLKYAYSVHYFFNGWVN